MEKIYNKIYDFIKSSHNIWIISHKSPDWDAIWSSFALQQVIQLNFFKKADILNIDLIWNKLKFISWKEKIKNKLNIKKYDLLIFLDTANLSRTWFFWEQKKIKIPIINIDHHITNDLYWDINLIESQETSTTIVLFKLFKYFKFKLNNLICTSLLAWIYTDSSVFKNKNVNSNTFFITAELIKKWWSLLKIVNNIFLKNDLSLIFLTKKVFSRLFITNKSIAITYLKNKDINKFKFWYEEIQNITYLLSLITWVKYSIFLYEKQNYVKWSFRTTKSNIDLSKIAAKFNWGWHKLASAFAIEWKIILKNKNIWIKQKNWSIIYF